MNMDERQQLSNVIFRGGILLVLLGLVVGSWAFFLGFAAVVASLIVAPSIVESLEAYQRSKDLERRLEDDTRAAVLRDELEAMRRRDRR